MVGLSAVGSPTGFSPEDGLDGGDAWSGTAEPECRSCREANDAPSAGLHFSSALLEGIGLTPEDWRWLRRCMEASLKGFSIGAGLKGGLALFSILARLRGRGTKGASLRKVASISNGEVVVSAAKETLRYGIFLGAYAGTFVAVDELIASIWGYKRTAGWRALLAGAVAGPSMLLTGLERQHTSLAIYILMRAAVLVSRCGIKSKRFGNVCKPLTWSHGDIFLMCLSSSQILSAYILKQESLLPSYKAFLNRHGGKAAVILQRVKEIATGTPFTNLDEVEKHYKFLGVDIKLDPSMKVPCSIVHGNQTCTGHFISFLIQSYGRALPVYTPVYLIPALIVHRQGLVKRHTFYKFPPFHPHELVGLAKMRVKECNKREISGLLQSCQRVLLVQQDLACFSPCTVRQPGVGHACYSEYLRDATLQWLQWGCSRRAWRLQLRRRAGGWRYLCTALHEQSKASSHVHRMLAFSPGLPG